MAFRNQSQYRSWNALALGIKEESVEKPDKVDDSSSKDPWRRPRRESWSQPPQRGRGTRGRGVWFIDNRPRTLRRRNTMPNSRDDYQDHDPIYNNLNNDRSNDCNQFGVDPIWEESSRNFSTSPDFDCKNDDDSEIKYEDQNCQDESSPWNSKPYSSNHIYHPPRSRSTSYIKDHWKTYSNNDDGTQSSGYSNGYEPDNYKVQRKREFTNNVPDQTWVHDKYETLESDSDSRDKKNASTQVSTLDLNNGLPGENNAKKVMVSSCEFSKNSEPKSWKDQTKDDKNLELPKEITIKFSDLTLKDSNKEKSESIISQTPIQEELLLIESEVTSEVTSKITSEITSEVTPKEIELPMLINLEEEDNTGLQPIQPRISQDILKVDWEGYQISLIEEELKLTMERQSIQTLSMRRNQTFRTTVWDPLLILSQIIALQTLYYTSISLITLFTLLVTGTDITLDHLLDYREFRADTVLGWTIGFAWIANSIRARLVLDFSLTLHFFHLLITTYYSGHMPTTFVWWALNATTCCIMIFGGEIYCMRKEMEPILLNDEIGEGAGGGASGSSAAVKTKTSADVDRDRYEMVPMEEIEVGG
ncbi:12236_t:CDS:10 [Funneliformis mosseae]|uniref:12236_t:CDS:1 n=1 Tax=Funneliformis mosseae TaxID=27381 RepID=A0A9N9DPW1_FUNMO|nr:12236_t:CDS:10 [Funneliformis mosseae]